MAFRDIQNFFKGCHLIVMDLNLNYICQVKYEFQSNFISHNPNNKKRSTPTNPSLFPKHLRAPKIQSPQQNIIHNSKLQQKQTKKAKPPHDIHGDPRTLENPIIMTKKSTRNLRNNSRLILRTTKLQSHLHSIRSTKHIPTIFT